MFFYTPFCEGIGKIVQNWQTEGKCDIRFAFVPCPKAYIGTSSGEVCR